MDARTKALKSRSKMLSPVMQVGKAGVTPGTIAQVGKELDLHGLIKIRILHAAIPGEEGRTDRKRIAQELASGTGAQLIDLVGNIVVLYRAPKE